MEVCDIAADRDVCGEGNFRFVGSAEEGIVGMLWITRKQSTTYRFAESDLISCTVTRGAVQQLARFFRTAERAFGKCCVYVFRSRSNHGNLCIMDQHRSVCRNPAYESVFH